MANLTDIFGGDTSGGTGEDGLTVAGSGGGIDNYPIGDGGEGPHGGDGFDDGGSSMTVAGGEGGIDNYPMGDGPGGFGSDGLIGGDMGHAQIEDLPIN